MICMQRFVLWTAVRFAVVLVLGAWFPRVGDVGGVWISPLFPNPNYTVQCQKRRRPVVQSTYVNAVIIRRNVNEYIMSE